MTREQRYKTKQALWNYSALQRLEDEESRNWCDAIRQTVDYYAGFDPLRAGILQRRYFEHATQEKTMELLCVGRTTFQKAQLDLLSTLAVFAARKGLL